MTYHLPLTDALMYNASIRDSPRCSVPLSVTHSLAHDLPRMRSSGVLNVALKEGIPCRGAFVEWPAE